MKLGTFIACVVGLALLLGACQRQATLVPPGGEQLREAELALRAGDYVRADALYSALGDGATGRQREIALARRALIYALPGTSVHNPVAAEEFLALLVAEYPETLMRTETEALLGVLPEVDALRVSAARSLDEIDELRGVIDEVREERERFTLFLGYVSPFAVGFDIERARSEYRGLLDSFPESLLLQTAERMLFLVSQWERLEALGSRPEATLEELRREVAALSDELETLKEIDLGRRLPD